MFFHVYGAHALLQWGMMLVVLAGLILWNEFARRTKMGGIITFLAIPLALTVYFVAIAIGARTGADWAVNNQTHLYMNGWFHYAKLYAALTGCIGFMMIKYKWGIGAKHWFKPFPFVIVAINILIAVASDFESAIKGWNCWWLSSEGVWLYGGWHNVMNGLAGIINIFCMTAWWNVYASKDKKDMIWADMTWVYIVIYDIWNFAYTYNCLPTHSWFCGIALLLAPTVAALLWNRGGWIQNRANTLAIWCMFERHRRGWHRQRQPHRYDRHQRPGTDYQHHRHLLHHQRLEETPHQSLQRGRLRQPEVLQRLHGPRRRRITRSRTMLKRPQNICGRFFFTAAFCGHLHLSRLVFILV